MKLVEEIKTGKKYAAKIIDKKALEKKGKGFFKDEEGNLIVNNLIQDSMREIAILKKLNDINIIKLYEIIYDEEGGKNYLSINKIYNHSNGMLQERCYNEIR